MLSVPITLFSCARRGVVRRRVDDEPRVDHGVDLGRLHDPADQRVLVRDAHELGALQLARRILGVDADDRLDVGVALERLREPPAPIGGEPGDQDAPAFWHRAHLVMLPPVEASEHLGRMPPMATDDATEGGAGPRRRFAARCGTAMEREGVARFPGRAGADPQLRQRARSGRAACAPSGVEEGQDDQGQSRRAADPLAAARAGGGQGARDGGAAAARRPSLPPARPEPADQGQDPRGGDDQGRAQARRGDRRRAGAQARPGPVRIRRGEPQGRADRKGRRLQRPRVRDARRGRDGLGEDDRRRRPCTRSRSCARTCPVTDPRHPGRPDRHAARRDRRRARVSSAPTGILWDHLQPPQIHEIPVLERMGYA